MKNTRITSHARNDAHNGPALISDLVSRLGSQARRLVAPTWIYTTAGGVAVLNRGDNFPLKRLGVYQTEAQARASCEAHYERCCRGLRNLGHTVPVAQYA